MKRSGWEYVRPSRRSRLLTTLLVAAGVVVLAIGIAVRVADLHVQTVLSNSMRPTVSAGDLAVTQAVPIGVVQVGDVITFRPQGSSQAVMHRITSLRDGVITTRGDANPVDDAWRVTLAGSTAYRLIAVVPFVGWLTELQRPALFIAGLLVGMSIVLELRKEVKARAMRSQPQFQT